VTQFDLVTVPTVNISKIQKSWMAAAVVLISRKIAIFPSRFDRSPRVLATQFLPLDR